jgi:hypothetical protein
MRVRLGRHPVITRQRVTPCNTLGWIVDMTLHFTPCAQKGPKKSLSERLDAYGQP